MKPAKISFQTHRFRDSVAVYIGSHVSPAHTANGKPESKGITIYLSPRDARRITRAINATARNVESFPKFSESPPSTRVHECEGEA